MELIDVIIAIINSVLFVISGTIVLFVMYLTIEMIVFFVDEVYCRAKRLYLKLKRRMKWQSK